MFAKKSRAGLALLTLTAVSIALSESLATGQGDASKTMEKNLDAGLREVINHGAAIFNNQGDYAGCYRLFEGALQTVKPLLGGYPELQKKVEVALSEANQQPSMHDRAHSLRKVLGEVRNTINPQADKKNENKSGLKMVIEDAI
jgi:hypothetical protein